MVRNIRTTNIELQRRPRGFSKSRGLAPRNFRLAAKQQNVLDRSAEEAGHQRFARLPRPNSTRRVAVSAARRLVGKLRSRPLPMMLCRTLAANLSNRGASPRDLKKEIATSIGSGYAG